MRGPNLDLEAPLTPRQLSVLRLIGDFHARQCYSPTIAELAAGLGLSRSTVFEHLGELQRKRLVSTWPGRARSLKLTGRGRSLLSHAPPVSAPPAETPDGDAGVPLLGRVAAGVPLEAVENHDSLSLESCFGMGGDLFALEVTGDSMIEENICPGDYVICRRRRTASDGDLVVAIVDGQDATLKRFYREANRVRLQPANTDYSPIYSADCRIEAVVVGLVRKL